MNKKQIVYLNSCQREHRRKSRLALLAAALSLIAVFFTVRALMLPAVTLGDDSGSGTVCGITAHTHDGSCYDAEGVLLCGLEEHEHTEACYAGDGETMPAQSFYAETAEVTVCVEAQEGAFPAGTYMTVMPVQDEAILNAAADTVVSEINSICAVDICFFNSLHEKIEPLLPISVTMTSYVVAESEDTVVVHVDDEGSASLVENVETGEGDVSFESDSFSVYVLVGTAIENTVLASDGRNYRITVTCGIDSGIPDDAKLVVSEILGASDLYGDYISKAEYALGMENSGTGYIRLFDIGIVDGDGNKIQPAEGSAVDVRIELADAEAAQDLGVVHFADENDTGSVVDAAVEGQTVSFEANGFSVYAVAGSMIEKTIEASDGQTYRVRVTFKQDAELPDGVDVAIAEFSNEQYADYVGRSLAALNAYEFDYARVFDISIVDAYGNEVQPSARVDVEVTLMDAEDLETSFYVMHFVGEGDLEETQYLDSFSDGNTVSFQTDSFSAYAIVQGPEALSLGWHRIESIEELIEKAGAGLFIGHKDGYYFGNTIVDDGTRVGIYKTKPAQPTPSDRAAKYCFEPVPGTDDQFYVYCMASDGITKQYVYNAGDNNLSFTTEDNKTPFTLTQNSNGYFQMNYAGWYWNMQGSANGTRFCSWNSANDNNAYFNIWYYDVVTDDPYGLDGKTYGLMHWNGGVAGRAMMAEEGEGNTLEAKVLIVMSTADNSDQLFVPNDSDISMWSFSWIDEDRYRISVTADGSTKYLKIDPNGLSLVSDQNDASEIQVVPGAGTRAGQLCLKCGETTLAYNETAGSFSVGGTAGNEWLKLVVPSELTTDYFLTYSAEKISVSDPSVTNGSRVIVYTRSWNEEKLRYDYYAISSDGTLVPVYENGGSIEWISGQINTLLWNFVEYYWEGTNDPNFYYELYNQYSEKYIAPQVTGGQILSDSTIGINMNGRRDGRYYSTILAWDEENYSYVGLKVENGRIVTCPKSEAMDFYFAVMQDLNIDDELTTVPTVDNTQYGITMKIVNFGEPLCKVNGTTTTQAQHNVMGNSDYVQWLGVPGLLGTDLDSNGYPTATLTQESLGTLFANAYDVNHLFILSSYNETGYFAFDSTQNFASLHGTDFVVYKELGTMDVSKKPTLQHGQFMPFNDLEAGVFASVNPKNIMNIAGEPLPDDDPRKFEQMYLVRNPDYYYGIELEASFVQTPSGLDAWGHDIIFEFTGDDDFWLYVDGELVLDLGGVHSALGGSVNFRTGAVVENGVHTTLRAVFERNYRTRHPGASDADVAAFLAEYFEEGSTVFRDDSTHTMKMFYMERGAGASNLKMRFNLAAVKKGTVQLTKELAGVDESDIMAEFPYQIIYTMENGTEHLLTNALPNNPMQDTDYVLYHDSINPVKYSQSLVIDGITYQDVFFLKPGETADISFPEGAVSYRIVECGVNTEVYSTVSANGEQLTGVPIDTGSIRSDFGIDYATTDDRPKVKYTNEVNPDALRTLTIKKRLYHEDGVTVIPPEDDSTEFSFRLYMSSEFDTLDVANMHSYHVKDPDGYYCRWDAPSQSFVRIGEGISDYSQLTEEQKAEATFTTSIYGSISNIRSGYTVEIRNVLAGTQYRVEERPWEIPDGYSFQKYDEYENNDGAGDHAGLVDRNGVPGVNGTVVSGTDPNVTVCNLKGWGLRVNKVWRDEDYMSWREPVYFALFTRDGADLVMVQGSLRQMPYEASPQTIYWYYDHLPVPGTTGVEDYIILEVSISAEDPTVDENGVVSNYGTVTPIPDGGTVLLSGTQKGEDDPLSFTYTVQYEEGQISDESNVRVDVVVNDRPGVILKKQDWSGNALAGAVFTLSDSNGNVLGPFCSDEDGLITIAFLSEDREYTLTETSVQRPYHGLENPITISVSNGTISVSGLDTEYYVLTQADGNSMACLTVKNRPYTFRAVKLDGDTDEPMEGVRFALHRQVTVDNVTAIDLNPMPGYENLVTNEEGVIPLLNNTLPAGTYELRELETLDGYDMLPAYIRFTVSPTGTIVLGAHPDGVTLTDEIGDDGTLNYLLTILNFRRKKVSFQKVDISNIGIALEGAVFDLYALDEDGETEILPALYTGLISGSDGLLHDGEGNTVFELPIGAYHLVETAAPSGYNLLTTAVTIWVGAEDVNYDEGTNISASGSGKSYDPETKVYTLKVSNSAGYTLPNTGGSGTRIFTILGGTIAAAAAAALLLWMMRRSICRLFPRRGA